MRFQNGVGSRETAEIELPPRFLYLLTGIAGASGNTASPKQGIALFHYLYER
jgi:hypothetical protein